MYNFSQGFPENKTEFLNYAYLTAGPTVSTINHLGRIRNHELDTLLFYSGQQYQIINSHLEDWKLVKDWDAKMRYKVEISRRLKTQKILSSATVIINALN